MHPQESAQQRLAYGVNDALEVVPIGRSLLYEEIKAGNLKTFKIRGRTLIAAEDLRTWLEAYRRAAG